jgi:hypothetical protein
MDDFQLEIAEFNKTQIKELLRLLDKIKIDDIKQLYLNSPEFQTKPFSIEQNLSYLFPKINKIKETLNKALTNNYIGYNELVEIWNYIYNELLNFKIINPLLLYLIRFYIYNFLYDIDYILEQKIDKGSIDPYFNGVKLRKKYKNSNVIYFTLKKYLANYKVKPFTEKEFLEFIKYEKGIEEQKQINKLFFLSHTKGNNEIIFPTDFSIENFQLKNDLKPIYSRIIKIDITSNEEILNDIILSIKKVFEKKEKREEYSTRIKRILESEQSIDHLELYENLNEYLQLFGNKEELDKLNEKYKNQLKIQELKNKLLQVIQLLKEILKKNIDKDFQYLIDILQQFINDNILSNDNININENIYIYLFILQEISNLYKPNYFDINTKPPIENLDFIIKTFEELFDFYINYININYIPIITLPKVIPKYRTGTQLSEGGFKKILKKYK